MTDGDNEQLETKRVGRQFGVMPTDENYHALGYKQECLRIPQASNIRLRDNRKNLSHTPEIKPGEVN